MSITTTTHLNLPGTARQALDLYASVFGGTVTAATYADLGMPADEPGAQKIVFGQVESPDGFRVMAYDVPGQDAADGSTVAGATRRENGLTLTDRTFFQSVRGESLADVEPIWAGLAEGATIVEPLAASAWSPGFGMLTDRFGGTWVIDVQAAYGG
jgi:PhnB protein